MLISFSDNEPLEENFIGGSKALADPRGRQRRAPGSKFFHFHAVFGKKFKK